MLISLNALKQYVKIPESLDNRELMKLIGSRLVEVEETEAIGKKYQNIFVAKVKKCTAIPNTHLHLCEIDAGKKLNQEFSTIESGLVQVVCGAPNIRKDLMVVWLAPGAIVPETFGRENFKLEVKKLRGFESYGMIAGSDELGFGTEHKYIVEIDSKLARPGDKFAETFGLDDLIINIENKSLTHRPDTFGLIGFAREVSGILGAKFQDPADFQEDFVSQVKVFGQKPANLSIEVKDSMLCPRYSCAILDRSQIKSEEFSSKFPDCRKLTRDTVLLYKSGMRPISQVVDATNLAMLETGQPLHAFDYDKFVAVGGTNQAKLIVRVAKKGEKLTLLDNSEINLSETDIIITSNNVPVALAGAMGGKNTEIDENTTRIILESATFSLYNLRKTQMAHGIFSEAITRFTKGQPAFGTIPSLRFCLNKLGIEDFSKVEFVDYLSDLPDREKISISDQTINKILGSNYSASVLKDTLQNVGFKVEAKEKDGFIEFSILAPLWRTDIHIKEDIIEEVGRLLGYDNIPIGYPIRPFIGSPTNQLYALKSKIRDILSSEVGAHELLTYSFISKDLIQKVGEDVSDSYEIVNSISPELQCFRQSIAPNLLEKIYENQKAGFKDFILYEMNQVAKKSFGLEEDRTPKLAHHLAVVSNGDFYQVKAILSKLSKRLGLSFEFTDFKPVHPYFEPLRSQSITLGGELIGNFGEIKYGVKKRLKLEQASAIELDLASLTQVDPTLRSTKKISRFPSVSRDLTIKTKKTVSYFAVESAILSSLSQKSDFVFNLSPTSIYSQATESPTKNLSFHLTFSSTLKTLDSNEISVIMKDIEQNILSLGAEII